MRPGGRSAKRIAGRIGIIVGAGWLGGAIGRALIGAGVLAPGDLCVSARTERRGAYAAWPEVTVTTDTGRRTGRRRGAERRRPPGIR